LSFVYCDVSQASQLVSSADDSVLLPGQQLLVTSASEDGWPNGVSSPYVYAAPFHAFAIESMQIAGWLCRCLSGVGARLLAKTRCIADVLQSAYQLLDCCNNCSFCYEILLHHFLARPFES
jgi:hypothetical protein